MTNPDTWLADFRRQLDSTVTAAKMLGAAVPNTNGHTAALCELARAQAVLDDMARCLGAAHQQAVADAQDAGAAGREAAEVLLREGWGHSEERGWELGPEVTHSRRAADNAASRLTRDGWTWNDAGEWFAPPPSPPSAEDVRYSAAVKRLEAVGATYDPFRQVWRMPGATCEA